MLASVHHQRLQVQLGKGSAQPFEQHAGAHHARVADDRHEARLGRCEQAAQAMSLILKHRHPQ